ncbi:MAG: hypothetical protein MJ084_04260 [Saccharofermentans sp.]|nr:hypothetical protein [Saccharofermentans sp.]
MGYAKYHEDDYRIYCDRIYASGLQDDVQHQRLIADHRCPYCQDLFPNRDSMFSHIRRSHNITEPILLLNGRVVHNNDHIYVSDIKMARIHLYGLEREIVISDEVISTENNVESINITEHINRCVVNNHICTVKIGSSICEIEKYSLYSVNSALLSDYISEWENTLKNSSTFKPFNIESNRFNPAETLYLKGIYNYFIACQAKDEDKTNRYYEANSILKMFVPTNSLGLCIQKIIAFKFNWINILEALCDSYGTNDDFRSVCAFFKHEAFDNSCFETKENSHIYMEDDLQDVFNAIVAFTKKDYDTVNQYLQLRNPQMITDQNLKDKILMLQSRMQSLNGNMNNAGYLFSEIKSDEFKQ